MTGSVWDPVVGQSAAIAQLQTAVERGPVHAYLFSGPPGSTKLEAARAFAALLVAGHDDPESRDARLILRGEHPDVREIRRTGAAIDTAQARHITQTASLSPIESDHQVLMLDEFHLVSPESAAILLKTIEEPPDSTTFIILADSVPKELVTISSRSVVIHFTAISTDLIATQLVADGLNPALATSVATSAYGNLDRARLLAADDSLAQRRAAFVEVPRRLDGSGNAAITVASDLLELIESAAEPLKQRHADERQTLDDRVEQLGERGAGRKDLDARHKRELRRFHTDELRAGLASVAAVYRDELLDPAVRDTNSLADAVHRVHRSIEMLDRNANERLLLEALFWSLPQIV